MEIFDLFSKINNKSNYIVDIGASGGATGDPVYPFITNSEYKGLCIEGQGIRVLELRMKVPSSFDVHCGYITPTNALDIFEKYNVPESPDILKIDIDGYDLEVLRVLLTRYRPKIIIAEINEKIPPPVLFEVKFKEEYAWDESHFYGFSIASGEKVMNQHGYKITQIYDLCNILCVSDEFDKTLPNRSIAEIYTNDYIENPSRRQAMPWNENVEFWLTIDNADLLKNQIQIYFEYMNDRSKFIIKTKKKDIDFLLE